MTNFNDQLHEDLFDLFIMHTVWGKPEYDLEFPDFSSSKAEQNYKNTKGLFPQESHSEEFARYVSDMGLSNIQKGHRASSASEKCFWYKNKIKITLENEQ
jgi:hypothetical protein